MRINRIATAKRLQARQDAIVFESEEDEGAAEHYAEIPSVLIVVLDSSKSSQDIRDTAAQVSLDSDIVEGS